jgi:cytosine deaminase
MSGSLTLAGVTLPGGEISDVVIDGETIAAVRPHGSADDRPDRPDRVDLRGFLLLPAPVETHAHLDKVLTAGMLTNGTGDLGGAVEAWYRYRTGASHGEIVDRATTAALMMLAHGCTAIRTHLDVGTRTGLRFLDALVAVREQLAGTVELNLVAFVDEPVSGAAGAGNRAVLRDALAHGADAVGGAPYRDPDPADSLDRLLAVAADHGAPMDLHTDETLDPSVSCLEMLAERVRTSGFPHRVTASHCVSLGTQSPARVRATAAELAAAGIAVVCCPATNLYLQGRDRPGPVPRGLTALRPLLAAGVVVAGGGDNIQDPFNPLGRGDPLDTAALLVLAGQLSVECAYAAVSTAARRVLSLPEVRLAPGSPAELVAVPAADLRQAMAERDTRRLVVHCGRIVKAL